MKTTARRRCHGSPARGEILYHTVCGNPGCGFGFELRVTRANIGLLSRRLACPRCRRPGGMLTRERRLGPRRFSSKLQFGDTRRDGSPSSGPEAYAVACTGGVHLA